MRGSCSAPPAAVALPHSRVVPAALARPGVQPAAHSLCRGCRSLQRAPDGTLCARAHPARTAAVSPGVHGAADKLAPIFNRVSQEMPAKYADIVGNSLDPVGQRVGAPFPPPPTMPPLPPLSEKAAGKRPAVQSPQVLRARRARRPGNSGSSGAHPGTHADPAPRRSAPRRGGRAQVALRRPSRARHPPPDPHRTGRAPPSRQAS